VVKVKKQFRQATCELTMLESHETPPCHLILRAVKNSRAFCRSRGFRSRTRLQDGVGQPEVNHRRWERTGALANRKFVLLLAVGKSSPRESAVQGTDLTDRFRIMLPSCQMLRDGQRSCDVCGASIPKGEKYVVSKVPREKARLFLEAMEANPEMSATVTPDSQGNLRLDICLDCHMNMGLPGTSTVN